MMVDSNNPFSLKWSLKRNSAGDSKAPSPIKNQSFNQHQKNDNDHYNCNEKIQTIADQKDDQRRQIFNEDTIDKIYEIQYKTRNPLDDQDSQSTQVNELIRAAKKLKLDELKSNSLSAMDVDCTSSAEKASSGIEKIQNFNFEQGVNELRRIEKKYCEWLIGQWVPSKEDAFQLLEHSRILLQSFQKVARISKIQSEEITNILELSSMLVEHIEGSIVECNTCSLDLMDYETSSIERQVTEKMSTDSNEQRNTEAYQLNWTSQPQSQESELTEQLFVAAETEGSLENSATEECNREDSQQSNTSFSDSILHQEGPVSRAEKVQEIRAVLLPCILHMLDNYEEWSEKYLDKTMHEFLEIRCKQTQ